MSNFVNNKPIGQILREASLVSNAQLEIALRDRAKFRDLRLGEILALRGWIKQQTVDFFAEQLPILTVESERKKIGFYLQQAGLLTQSQIAWILHQQTQINSTKKFGELACEQGWIKYNTINFFLDYLSLESNSKNQINSLPFLDIKDTLTRYLMGNYDLRRSQLNQVQFSNIFLEKANLESSQIKEADLEESILDYCNLRKTDLAYSNLAGASLFRANLSYAFLKRCNLYQAYLKEANLTGANLTGANLSKTNLQNAFLNNASLQGADLREANLKGVSLQGAYYDNNTNFDEEINPQKLGMQKL